MARTAKKPILVAAERDIQSLQVAKQFVYEVDIYGYINNGIYLHDSKYISAKDESADVCEYFMKDNQKFKRNVTLIAAPIKWLKEKGYNENK